MRSSGGRLMPSSRSSTKSRNCGPSSGGKPSMSAMTRMRVIADMLGFPPEDGPQFRDFVEDLLEGINLPPEDRIQRMERLFTYLLDQVHDHLDNPRDDITSYLIGAEIFGQKLTADHVTGAMALLLIAGIDTTWSAIGSSLWHLARTPADRRR